MATTKIRRIPVAESVSGPASMRPSGANPGRDVTAQTQGGLNLAAGLNTLATGLGNAGAHIYQQEVIADVSKADTEWLKGSLDIGNVFEADGDYTTFNKRATEQTTQLKDRAAKLIRDPEARQKWLDSTEQKRLTFVDAINDRGRDLSNSANVGKVETSLSELSKIYADPTTPQVVRDNALTHMETQIAALEAGGMITPQRGAELRRIAIVGSGEDLAVNRALYEIQVRPGVMPGKLGIPSESDDGTGVITALSAANGGTLPPMEGSLARVTADLLGDANFPDDPALVGAYLSDPDKAAEYAGAAAAMLSDRYKGDLTAVAVAMDPDGGTALADKWIASGHDEKVLPPNVRTRYRRTMQGYASPVAGTRIPINAPPDVDLAHTDPMVLDRFELLQGNFGEAIPLLSAARSEEHNKAVGGADKSKHLDGRALDLDVSHLSIERRVQLIQMASAMGFTGVGVYENSLHFDTGNLRAWGKGDGAVPAWATEVVAGHVAGKVSDVPLVYLPVSPEYAAIPFPKRITLAAEARRAAAEVNVTRKASIETIIENAPAAIANTGAYDGKIPTANEFVEVYGAADGIARYKALEAAIDTSKAIYGFRGATNEEIMAQVDAAVPTSGGNDAALESRRFETIAAAAEQTLKAREADPAGYVMNVFPKVAQAFEEANDDPEKFAAALTAMQSAQEQLGLDDMELLPKSMATAAVATFNDIQADEKDRIGSVAQLLLATQDDKQQLAIYQQLVKAGLPEYTQGAVAAMVRGDVSGSMNLMRAVMIDPEKLAGAMPGGHTGAQINAAIQERIMGEGMIGDVIYGVSSGSIDNFQRVLADSTLITRDVKMHLLDGSAGGDLYKAVDMTIKDMFGDVQVVSGENVRVAIPAGEDPAPLRKGFTGLRASVGDALREDMKNGMVQLLGDDVAIETTGMSTIATMGIDNAVSQVMREGYFTNAGGDQYQFFNPFTGTVIGKADGQPLLFTKAEVIAAGANVPAPTGWGTDEATVYQPSAPADPNDLGWGMRR